VLPATAEHELTGVEKDGHVGTVAAKPGSGYAVDESTVFVSWNLWAVKPNPSPETARNLIGT
jgi:hypothetical protein